MSASPAHPTRCGKTSLRPRARRHGAPPRSGEAAPPARRQRQSPTLGFAPACGPALHPAQARRGRPDGVGDGDERRTVHLPALPEQRNVEVDVGDWTNLPSPPLPRRPLRGHCPAQSGDAPHEPFGGGHVVHGSCDRTPECPAQQRVLQRVVTVPRQRGSSRGAGAGESVGQVSAQCRRGWPPRDNASRPTCVRGIPAPVSARW